MLDKITDQSSRLMKARLIRGFRSAKAAAEYFGWNYSSYIQHEQGLRGISRASKKYATAFRVSEGWLLTGEGDGPSVPAPDFAQTIDAKIIDLLQTTSHPDKEAILHLLNRLNSEEKK
ncbi:XRE family transcriptional regulator [Bartonella machadoae]|uniref:XRE family transcriptional regulator n=1 Tax=Bartonella machadoae TaxID=2893471 RepID=UPI001F4CFB2F|nr:XRE family transcriptional regulator [Bartonella machadoae]UNE55331.1 XRE family transcriptional regulator [Bartonella machadoae]